MDALKDEFLDFCVVDFTCIKGCINDGSSRLSPQQFLDNPYENDYLLRVYSFCGKWTISGKYFPRSHFPGKWLFSGIWLKLENVSEIFFWCSVRKIFSAP